MHTRDSLAADFRALGLAAGDVVMVHASVRSVGEIAGGPDQIHLALKDVLTDAGTLVMYASCPEYVDEIGRGHLFKEQEAEIFDKLPAFDPETARSARDNGALVELFRTYPGSHVNHHVTRFVSWGQQTSYLFSSQPWNYAFGCGSALDRLVGLDARVLIIGCDHDTVTFLHYVEHVADFPSKRIARFKVPILQNGVRVWREMEEFDSSCLGAHEHWPERFFAKLVDEYLTSTRNDGARVGNAQCYLLPVRGLLAFARPIMERVASDRDAGLTLRELGSG